MNTIWVCPKIYYHPCGPLCFGAVQITDAPELQHPGVADVVQTERMVKEVMEGQKISESFKEDKGKKLDGDKPRMDLIPMDALLEVAKVLSFGSRKYGDRNWEKGIHRDRMRGAQLRHDAATMMGESLDPESGLLHVAHKACGALMELALRLRNLDA
jgi:hypothetical protein